MDSGITYTALNNFINAINHGSDERWNQTLKNMIIKFVNEKKEDWDAYIDCHVFALNTTKHASSPLKSCLEEKQYCLLNCHIMRKKKNCCMTMRIQILASKTG